MATALEVIGAKVVNPGAGPTACTPSAGDTFSVRFAPGQTQAFLVALWGQEASAGFVQVRSPKLHDPVRGFRGRVLAGVTRNLVDLRFSQRLTPQDVLTIEAAGGAAETDAFGLLIYYPDFQGPTQRLAAWEQVDPRAQNYLTVDLAMVAPTVAGDWSAGTLLNVAASGDLLKPNTDYALLGYLTDLACTSVSVRGADTGNLRIGGPGTTEAIETRSWFADLARDLGTPAIPILNSAGKGAIVVSQQNNAAAGTPNVDLILAELSG